MEAGIHGVWREYRNTFGVMENSIGLNLDEILTPYTPSALYSKSGKVAVAPVMNSDDEEIAKTTARRNPMESPSSMLQSTNKNPTDSFLKPLAAMLPPPLDLALLADFQTTSPLSTADRVSAIGLLGAWADFRQEDETSWNIYDKVSAEELFLKTAGITPTLYQELVSPLLHVLPMCPGYDCSAAAALSCFHVFALQAKGAFDVRWCRAGIAESIFNPWATKLTTGGVNIHGNSKVTSIASDNNQQLEICLMGNTTDPILCDAVILAVGGTAMGRLADASPIFDTIPMAKTFDKLRGVTCVAVRLFLKPHPMATSGLTGGQYDSTTLPPDVAKAMKESPVAVCGPQMGNMPHLKETGFCIYDLQRLHDEFSVANNPQNTTAVLEVDFFRADAIADMDDNQVAKIALKAVSASLRTKRIPFEDVVDLAVVRARNAVSHFTVNSASYSPDVRLYAPNIYMCGDWIDRKGHASWSTEKAVVTGRQAAQAVLEDYTSSNVVTKIDIIPAASDTPPLQALRSTAKVLRSVVPPPGNGIPPSPWAFLQSLSQR